MIQRQRSPLPLLIPLPCPPTCPPTRLPPPPPLQDIHSGRATVRESLLFSARLRLPGSITLAQVHQLVDETLEMTELTRLQHNIVGEGEGGQGLSVEQRALRRAALRRAVLRCAALCCAQGEAAVGCRRTTPVFLSVCLPLICHFVFLDLQASASALLWSWRLRLLSCFSSEGLWGSACACLNICSLFPCAPLSLLPTLC